MVKNPPTVADLFRLDDMESLRRRQEDHALFYLFELHDLLPGGQRLAIDVISGVTRVYQETTTVAETRLDEMEIRLFTALLISHPFCVARYQMHALSQLHEGIDVKGQRERAVQEDNNGKPVRDVITACNIKLTSLALVIAPIDQETAYQLTSAHPEKPGINEEEMHALETREQNQRGQ